MLSEKTIERLIIYRTLLQKLIEKGQTNVFSYQIAELSTNTAPQVRRDLMVVGYTGNPRKGYSIKELIQSISRFVEQPEGVHIVIIGAGNLGRAILSYFSSQAARFKIVAAFDSDPNKIDRLIAGVPCRSINEVASALSGLDSPVAVITVPAPEAQAVTDIVVGAGVKAVVNFAPVRLKVPAGVYLDNIDMRLSFEKAAFFSRVMEREQEKESSHDRF